MFIKFYLCCILLVFSVLAAPLQSTIPVDVVKSVKSVENPITPSEPVKVNNYYQIGTAGELLWFRDHVNKAKDNLGANAVLTADIDLENKEWIPIAVGDGNNVYSGIFDGAGYTISHYVLNTEWLFNYYKEQGKSISDARKMIQNSGFIGSCKGTVKNLILEDVTVISNANGGLGNPNNMISKPVSVGSIIGWLNGGIVDNVIVSGNLFADGTGVALGGVVGNAMAGTISNSTSSVTISSNTDTSTVYIGGIVGYTKENANHVGPKLENDIWNGNIIENAGHGESGGIAGYVFSGSLSVDNVTYNKEGVEGSFGKACDNCKVSGDVDYGIYKIYTVDGQKVCEINGAYKHAVQDGVFTVKDANDSIVFDRKFNIGKYSTLSLPFNINKSNISGANFYKLLAVTKDETGKYVVQFGPETDNIIAGKPYIIEPTAETITIKGKYTLTNTLPISSADGDWELHSIYKYTTGTDMGDKLGKIYGFVAKDTVINGTSWSAGQFVKMGSGAYIYPFRVLLEYIGDNPIGDGTSLSKSAGTNINDFAPNTIDVVIIKDTVTNNAISKRLPEDLLLLQLEELHIMPVYKRFDNKINILHKHKQYTIHGKLVQ